MWLVSRLHLALRRSVELEPIGRLRIVVRVLNSTPLGLYILGGKDEMHPSMDICGVALDKAFRSRHNK